MKIICFSSYTAIWYSAFPEAIIAHELQKSGHEVLYITPGNEFPTRSNPVNESILKKEFGLKGYGIGSVLSSNDRKKISSIMKTINQNNFESLIIDGINIGKISLYEVLLAHKKMTNTLSKSEWRESLLEIVNTLTSFYACRKILKKEKPDRIIVYNALYSVNYVWVKYAKKLKIPVYFVTSGGNLTDMGDTVLIAKEDAIYYSNKLKTIWKQFKDIQITKKQANYVTNHYLELLKAKHTLVYSEPKNAKNRDIRSIYGIKNNQKILTATMSSYDELFAAQYIGAWRIPRNLIFSSQAEWINALIDFVKHKKDLFLLIRVHPREFPNRRNGIKSEHVKMLEKVLKNLPSNVSVNWPADKVSIYDLAQATNVILNAWSTVGVEMSLLGIPVVIYSSELVLYPSDLNYLAKDRKDYFAKIELAIKEGWSYERIKNTYRWLALQYGRTTIKYRDSKIELGARIISKSTLAISNYIYGKFAPKVRTFISKILYTIPIMGVGKNQKKDCLEYLTKPIDISRVEKMLEKSSDTLIDTKKVFKLPSSNKEEDLNIRNEIKRIYKALYGNMPKSSRIKKNSLQHNLRKLISQ